MKRQRAWIVWLVLAGVFVAGGVTGGFVSLRVAKALVNDGRTANKFAPRVMERLDSELELTAAQQAEIQPIIDKTWAKLKEYRHSSFDAMRAMETEITEHLTLAQKERYAAIQAEHRSRWQKMVGRKGKDGPDGDRPPPPPGGFDGERPPPPPDGAMGEPPPLPPPEGESGS